MWRHFNMLLFDIRCFKLWRFNVWRHFFSPRRITTNLSSLSCPMPTSIVTVFHRLTSQRSWTAATRSQPSPSSSAPSAIRLTSVSSTLWQLFQNARSLKILSWNGLVFWISCHKHVCWKWPQADRLAKKLPSGKGFVCLDTKKIPEVMKTIFTSTMLKWCSIESALSPHCSEALLKLVVVKCN